MKNRKNNISNFKTVSFGPLYYVFFFNQILTPTPIKVKELYQLKYLMGRYLWEHRPTQSTADVKKKLCSQVTSTFSL